MELHVSQALVVTVKVTPQEGAMPRFALVFRGTSVFEMFSINSVSTKLGSGMFHTQRFYKISLMWKIT